MMIVFSGLSVAVCWICVLGSAMNGNWLSALGWLCATYWSYSYLTKEK